MSPEPTFPEKRPSRSRWVQDSTLGAGAVLILALFVLVNYLAIRHYQRFDWTSNKIYSLSSKSLNIVEGITDEIDLVIFISPESPIYGPVGELLSSYAAGNSKLRKREVDPAKNLIEAQRLVQRYNIERDNVVIVASGDGRKTSSPIYSSPLARTSSRKRSMLRSHSAIEPTFPTNLRWRRSFSPL